MSTSTVPPVLTEAELAAAIDAMGLDNLRRNMPQYRTAAEVAKDLFVAARLARHEAHVAALDAAIGSTVVVRGKDGDDRGTLLGRAEGWGGRDPFRVQVGNLDFVIEAALISLGET